MTITQAIAELRGPTLPDESAMLNYAECQALLSLVSEVERLRKALRKIAHGEPDYSVNAWRHYSDLARAALTQEQ